MPISGRNIGKIHGYPRLTEDEQYFEIGEMFVFSPESGKDILFKTEEVSYPPDFLCSEKCGFWRYCVSNEDFKGVTPKCTNLTRKDGKTAYFVKVDH